MLELVHVTLTARLIPQFSQLDSFLWLKSSLDLSEFEKEGYDGYYSSTYRIDVNMDVTSSEHQKQELFLEELAKEFPE